MKSSETELRIREFLGKYAPEIAAATQDCRAKLRALAPRGFELVYDNYNALVFGFGPSEKSSEAVLSIAAYPRWVTLFFLKGATLKDPNALLQGTGKHVRRITLSTPEDLEQQEVRRLINEALAPVAAAMEKAGALQTVIKSVSAKQRPRRPAEARRQDVSARRAPKDV